MKISARVMNIALHGLGRVGRSILRRCVSHPQFNVVAVNDLTPDVENIAYCLNYDSIYGHFPKKVIAKDNKLFIGDQSIRVLNEPDVSAVRWTDLGADILIDSSGIYENTPVLKQMTVSNRLGRAFKTCLAPDADLVLTLGSNQEEFRNSQHRVISTNTCDATAIAPVLAVLDKSIGIENVNISIIHPWLNNQNLLDTYTFDNKKNYELGRASDGNIIAKTTSAESAIRAVLPHIPYISAISYRIPTSIVTCADLSFRFKRTTSRDEVLSALKLNSSWNLIGMNTEPLVSSDFKGSDYSATIEERLLTVDGKLGRITLWYDNESGYAARVLDQVMYCAGAGE